ncbi:hypothetical protein BH24ACI5_BH24ACI5_22570 [soil metagenome]
MKLTGRRVLLVGVGGGVTIALSSDGHAPEFIDLGEDHTCTPEVMDGECSA